MVRTGNAPTALAKRHLVGIALAIILASLSGCTSPAEPEERPSRLEEMWKQQDWALQDGMVTNQEYESAMADFITCLRLGSVQVTDPIVSPIDGLTLLYELEMSGDPKKWNNTVEVCNETKISQIEAAFVESRQQVMDPRLRKPTAECLRARGLSVTGNETNVREFRSATSGSQAVSDCVMRALYKEFPDMPSHVPLRG